MNRRRFLVACGAVGFAGCSGGPSEDDNDATPESDEGSDGDSGEGDTPDSTPTSNDETPTPEPAAPTINDVGILSGFEEFGDLSAKAISEPPAGSEIWVGWESTVVVHDGTYAVTNQVEVLDSAGNRVAINSDTSEQVVDESGPTDWQGALPFRADWEPGEYTAEAIVRDDVTEKVSESETVDFTLTEPEPKLEIVSSERYTEEYSEGVRGVARNVSEEVLAYAEVSAVFLDSDGAQVGDGIDNTSDLQPGRKWRFDCSYLGDADFSGYELSTDWRVD